MQASLQSGVGTFDGLVEGDGGEADVRAQVPQHGRAIPAGAQQAPAIGGEVQRGHRTEVALHVHAEALNAAHTQYMLCCGRSTLKSLQCVCRQGTEAMPAVSAVSVRDARWSLPWLRGGVPPDAGCFPGCWRYLEGGGSAFGDQVPHKDLPIIPSGHQP